MLKLPKRIGGKNCERIMLMTTEKVSKQDFWLLFVNPPSKPSL